MVGGGNTFHLAHFLNKYDLLESIRLEVSNSVPYMGWSAGSNVACPTMQTTNDMPILPLQNYRTLNVVPFQINVHYTEETLPNHGGETRADRLNEYTEVNPDTAVIGLREHSGIIVKEGKLELIGHHPAECFRKGDHQRRIELGEFTI